MKVGDLVRPVSSKDYLDEGAIGVIVDSREMFATRRADKGENTHCHQIYWTAPAYNITWVTERDLAGVSI